MSRFGSRSRVSTYLSDWMPTGDAVPFTRYVIFTSSGTLNVTGSGLVGVCTVGGGGGSGFDISGGGGGGELDLFANFAVAGNLTITIGAGGTVSTVAATVGGNGGTSTVSDGVTTFQTALGGGGGGGGLLSGGIGGSGGGGAYNSGAGGGASGSNTFAGGAGQVSLDPYGGGGGGGATAVGLGTATYTGGQGYALSSIDANLTAANFPTTLTGITHVSSGGGGHMYSPTDAGNQAAGGTNAGSGVYKSSVRAIAATSPTGYGCGGGGGGGFGLAGTAGFAGLVIIKIASTTGIAVSGGQETVDIPL